MHVGQLNYAYDRQIRDPDALLDAYFTLTGWSEALLVAGARQVSVWQRFGKNARLVRNGVTYHFVADRAVWGAAKAIHRSAVRERPDLLHVHGLDTAVSVARLRRLAARIPIVVQDHASGRPAPLTGVRARLRRLVWRRGLGTAEAFFFTAREQAQPWQEAALIPPGAQICEVLESSTALTPVPRVEAKLQTGVDGSPAMLWVGRLNENKDPLTVLAAFERASESLPGSTLTMVYGEADLLPEVRARIASSPALRNRVRLVGQVAHGQMPAYYSAADIFVLGSHRESCGYALLEACACALVPVVTDIPSFRTITGHGAIGALWRAGDAGDCARAILGAARGDRAAATAQVRDRVAAALSWQAVGEAAMRAYGEVLDASRLRAPA